VARAVAEAVAADVVAAVVAAVAAADDVFDERLRFKVEAPAADEPRIQPTPA
jgi:hypothetical protein